MIGSKRKLYKCPFCFEEFKKGEHHYRSRTSLECVRDFPKAARVMRRPEIALPWRVGYEFNSEVHDDKYSAYLEQFYGMSEDAAFVASKDYVALEFKQLTTNVPVKNNREGFVSYNKKYLNETPTINKGSGVYRLDILCPKCHNRLPDDYETADELTIAVIGRTSAGKTVYFTALYHMLASGGFIDERNLRTRELAGNLPDLSDALYTNPERALTFPVGTIIKTTKDTDIIPPYIFSFTNSNGSKFNAFFYDIAGENVSGKKAADWIDRRARHLTEVDGIIFVIDASTLSVSNKDIKLVEEICNNLYSASGGRVLTPVAVALSKADMIPELRNMFDYFSPKQGGDYNAHDYDDERRQRINKYVQKFLSQKNHEAPKKEIITESGHIEQRADTSLSAETMAEPKPTKEILTLIDGAFSKDAFYCFFASVVDRKDSSGISQTYATPRFVTDAFMWLANRNNYRPVPPHKS